MFKKIIPQLSAISDLTVKENEAMSSHTTFRTGGPALVFCEAHTEASIISALKLLYENDLSPLVIGNGSNLLVPDNGLSRIVLKLSCNKISVCDNVLTAEAGASLALIANTAMKHHLSGLEFAHGIPGSLGGAIVMNAGAYGGEIKDVLKKTTYFSNGEVFEISNKEHLFGYRSSVFKNNPEFTVLSAEFILSPGKSEDISQLMKSLADKRRSKQPLEYPNAGSVFKRPEGYFAGALIEQCNLKGYRIGGAEVSEKHAGFIVNRGGATSTDIKKLILHIQETVLRETGVSLECEICIL